MQSNVSQPRCTECYFCILELSANTAAFAKSAAMLGNSEDHTALSRALSQLAEVEEKIDQLHQEQAFADFYMFSELLGDYIRLIAAVKVSTGWKRVNFVFKVTILDFYIQGKWMFVCVCTFFTQFRQGFCLSLRVKWMNLWSIIQVMKVGKKSQDAEKM